MIDLYSPLCSLREGSWFKLICGASYQHLPAIRNLVLVYALAGADCIDVAADPAVILTARSALDVAMELAKREPRRWAGFRHRPWLMVSFNDGEDPHFRKAEFSAANCPTDCLRPCELVCPAQAIALQVSPSVGGTAAPELGVIQERCYGCGRCLPVCPVQHISARSYVSTPEAVAPLVIQTGVDAIELHTQVGRLEDFRRLWQAIAPWVNQLQLLAISCPDGDGLIEYLWTLYELLSPLPCPLVWQTDGRPMSGDIGIGTTRAAIKLGQKVLASGPPGYVQLAGGTNHHTVPKLKSLGLLGSTSRIAGVAYGSYARSQLTEVIDQLEVREGSAAGLALSRIEPSQAATLSEIPHIEDVPALLAEAVELAESLVLQLKGHDRYEALKPLPLPIFDLD